MLDTAELLRLARSGATLLLPNLRAVRHLRRQFAAMTSGTDQAVASIDAADLHDRIMHWRGWTATLWQQALLNGDDDRALLNPLQERLLWERLLDDEDGMQRTGALVDLCLSASTLIHQYNAALAVQAHSNAGRQDDTVRFAQWFQRMAHYCGVERLLPGAALESALVSHVEKTSKKQVAANTLVLCNLPVLRPAQQALLDALRQSGVSILAAPQRQAGHAVAPVLLRCTDDRDELHTLAGLLREALQSPTRPDIAVVVPDLSTARDRIDRFLREHLQAAQTDPFHEERQPLWEFSTGRPLASVALVADALRLLRWTVQPVDTAVLSTVLRSPYFDWPVDAETAASLDAGLLRRNRQLRSTWTPRQAAYALRPRAAGLADTLAARTVHWADLRNTAATYSTLAERARTVLREFGWPGSRPRSSVEFQTVRRWQSALDTLSTLDLVAPPLAWADFVQRLASVLRDTHFAPENTAAPIQFLTPEESTGIEAAELWVAHVDEDHWSSSRPAHPLLPRSLQQSHGMPGVDPALDGAAFRQEVERLLTIAPEATFSYASAGDSGEQRPAPLLLELPGVTLRESDPAGTVSGINAAAALELEVFADDSLVPLTPQAGSIRGGVNILKGQGACAFRAFAENRLAASALETRDLGWDARDRGSHLHDALQIFWDEHKQQETLLQLMRDDRLESAIQHAVRHALPEADNDTWDAAYRSIQHDRLVHLMRQWLHMEAERPPFTVVATEQEATVNVGPLPLKVRVDRIDEVHTAAGTYRVILDYKTGEQSAKKWLGDRPDEPQLPLYATALGSTANDAPEAPVGAIAFGIVRAGDDLRFRSLPDKSGLLHRGAGDTVLGVELDQWRETLATLAHDFAAGIAAVGPKEYPATCKFCDQRLLCRLNPERLEAEEGGDEA